MGVPDKIITLDIKTFEGYETNYAENFEYESTVNIYTDRTETTTQTLTRLHTPEGYITTVSSPQYHYYRRDHLGNNREVWLANTNTTLQRTQYYPSGLPWAESVGEGMQPYKFNGCEFIEMHGLDVTDLGNRGVQNATNRFTSLDRFCEKFPWQSPYVHAGNNPVNYIDVNGDSIKVTEDAILAIYHSLDQNSNVHFDVRNGLINPESLKTQAENSDDIVLKDLYEIASNAKMVELSISDKETYNDSNGNTHNLEFQKPYDFDINDLEPEAAQQLKNMGEPEGKTIQGNLGVTLLPGNASQSGKRSTNGNIQIIINGKGSLNHRAVGVSHEFGHVVLYLRGLPSGHGQPGVDKAVYNERSDIVKRRLGYDY